MKRTLAVDLGGIALSTPLVAASGTFGTGREGGLLDTRRLGAAVSRSITLAPRKGAPSPRVAETASGLLWSVGLQNPGIDAFLADELPRLTRTGIPLFVSIAGSSLEEYVRLASVLQDVQGIAGIEVYLRGEGEAQEGEPFLSSAEHVVGVVGAVSRLSRLPVVAKLPVSLADLVESARGCVRAGAHGLTIDGSAPGMAIDTARLRPEVGAISGFLSGPAVRPFTVRAVFEVARILPEVPILAAGGVWTGNDAVELLLAGAWAVEMGTALLVDPSAATAAADGILGYLKHKGLASPADIRGRVRIPEPGTGEEAG